MARSSRSSSLKKNNTALKKRVFGPVETARSVRLSAKLLALAQQPKPLRPEMEVEEASKDADAESKEDEHAQGALSFLPIPVPTSLLAHDQLPTTPGAAPLAAAHTVPILDIPTQNAMAKEELFYHLLGVSTNVQGFDKNGNLQLSFAADDSDE